MIVTKVFLICDTCGKTYAAGDDGESSSKEVRKDAKRDGWVHKYGSDFCENCKWQ